jgi:hypothetical protein
VGRDRAGVAPEDGDGDHQERPHVPVLSWHRDGLRVAAGGVLGLWWGGIRGEELIEGGKTYGPIARPEGERGSSRLANPQNDSPTLAVSIAISTGEVMRNGRHAESGTCGVTRSASKGPLANRRVSTRVLVASAGPVEIGIEKAEGCKWQGGDVGRQAAGVEIGIEKAEGCKLISAVTRMRRSSSRSGSRRPKDARILAPARPADRGRVEIGIEKAEGCKMRRERLKGRPSSVEIGIEKAEGLTHADSEYQS